MIPSREDDDERRPAVDHVHHRATTGRRWGRLRACTGAGSRASTTSAWIVDRAALRAGVNVSGTSPLAATFARLRRLDQYLVAEVGPAQGAGWYDLDRVVDDGHLDVWLDELARTHDGQRDVAGAYLGSWLAGALVAAPVSALVLERRMPHLGAGVWLHRHEEGWFDGVAFASAQLLVLADDPEADHGDAVVVADQSTLVERYAHALVERLTPLLEAVRRRAPYGLRGLWGAVADDVTGTVLATARRAGTDGWLAWDQAQTVLDDVAARQEHLRKRPTPFPVSWSGGETLYQVKGTCCLYYKTHDGPLDPDGESYCTTCPFRYDDNRLCRLRRHLEDPERV